MSELDVRVVLNKHRLLLCGGSGGVGKTTTAAALGLMAAEQDRRTLVLTIDPARRLANAMGVSEIGHEPAPVPSVPNLWVMMLDAGQSIDALVSQHAPDRKASDALLNNPYYRQISASVAGSREFIAMEKLHDLLADERFDLLIVDTPPAQHALDFLDAPKRLLELLDGSGLGLLLRTTSVANRLSFGLLGRSQKQFAKLFEQLTGHRMMLDLSAFYDTFEDVIAGFRSRAATMQRTLRGADVAFLLVLIPQADAMAAAQSYLQRLRSESMTLAGLLFNQVLPIESLPISVADAKAALLQRGMLPEQVDAAIDSYSVWHARAQEQGRQMQRWRSSTGVSCAGVPRFGSAIGSIDDLQRFAAALIPD